MGKGCATAVKQAQPTSQRTHTVPHRVKCSWSGGCERVRDRHRSCTRCRVERAEVFALLLSASQPARHCHKQQQQQQQHVSKGCQPRRPPDAAPMLLHAHTAGSGSMLNRRPWFAGQPQQGKCGGCRLGLVCGKWLAALVCTSDRDQPLSSSSSRGPAATTSQPVPPRVVVQHACPVTVSGWGGARGNCSCAQPAATATQQGGAPSVCG